MYRAEIAVPTTHRYSLDISNLSSKHIKMLVLNLKSLNKKQLYTLVGNQQLPMGCN